MMDLKMKAMLFIILLGGALTAWAIYRAATQKQQDYGTRQEWGNAALNGAFFTMAGWTLSNFGNGWAAIYCSLALTAIGAILKLWPRVRLVH